MYAKCRFNPDSNSFFFNAELAHLVERHPSKLEAASSSLAFRSMKELLYQ